MAQASFMSLVPKDALVGRKVLIIVENLPVPFDRRVWLEARTLKAAGAVVSIICPTGKGYEARFEEIDGIFIYRHTLPVEQGSGMGYLKEYAVALFHETRLAWKVFFQRGFDVIHACNPPDLIFLVALPFKILGKKFVFDHHDVNPELYEAKFGRRDFFWRLLLLMERATFWLADVSIATNESYRNIAIERGRMKPENVHVVRSGPDISAIKAVTENPAMRNGHKYLVAYVGVMGEQEGIDLLLEAIDFIVHKLHRDDIQLTLAGDGPVLESLKNMASSLGIDAHVRFLGRVPDKELFELLSTADVCVNPDRVNAMNDISTMNKIMEYMAFGKPIVQFDVREGRVSAEAASLYASKNDPTDFANCIVTLLADEPRRKKMGEFGYNRVRKELSWETQIAPLLEAYAKTTPG
jgi:glycosyltransferase involved in cell wall biosynthesis